MTTNTTTIDLDALRAHFEDEVFKARFDASIKRVGTGCVTFMPVDCPPAAELLRRDPERPDDYADEHISAMWFGAKIGAGFTAASGELRIAAPAARGPVVVPADADADEMNRLHGEDYGKDWVYPTESAAPAATGPVVARVELELAYRCIQGMYHALTTETLFNQGYHAPTIGAAKRFVFEGALDGSEYFIGKPVGVLHAALALPATEKNHE